MTGRCPLLTLEHRRALRPNSALHAHGECQREKKRLHAFLNKGPEFSLQGPQPGLQLQVPLLLGHNMTRRVCCSVCCV